MHINVRKIEAPGTIRSVQDVRDVARHVKRERRREIVGGAYLTGQLLKRDVAPIARDDSLEIKQHVSGRARVHPHMPTYRDWPSR